MEQTLEATLHLPAISRTIKIRARQVGHWWRGKAELRNDLLLWAPSHRRDSGGWPTRIYLQKLCADIACSLEDLLGAMDNGDE